ncbi:MAG TPA: septal ring lytic transglycosylase RlpA family protein [Nevskiaceae bacterium]
MGGRSDDSAEAGSAEPDWQPSGDNDNPASYTVGGKTYHVLQRDADFTQTGEASWYGKKFQGRPTASGQPYDMYAMTAAHPTLPIPSYVKVTNLRNGKSAIVRINDRGPFHKGRIIDLSYAAAAKIGMLNHGSAKVKLAVITPRKPASPEVPPEMVASAKGKLRKVALHNHPAGEHRSARQVAENSRYLQAGIFLDRDNAAVLRDRIQNAGVTGLQLVPGEYAGTPATRVLIGPLEGSTQLQAVRQQLADNGIPSTPSYR